MILIADSGSTKTDWAVIDTKTREVVDNFTTPGFNPSQTSEEDMRGFLTAELKPQVADLLENVNKVYFYGSGCVGQAATKLGKVLSEIVDCTHIDVLSDLIGAARSMAGGERGIVAILGTGSNSGLWNGEAFTEHVPSLGYVLGDEGSGGYLGKVLLCEILRGRLPEEICNSFMEQYCLTEADVIHRVYRLPRPNAFLASFVPFLKVNLDQPAIYALVEDAFDTFVKNNLLRYTDCHTLPCSFTGGVAVTFADVLGKVLEKNGLRQGKIVKRPIQGLIEYHKNNQ